MQSREGVGMFLLGLGLALVGPLWIISVFGREDAPERPGDSPLSRRTPIEQPRYGSAAIYLFGAVFIIGGIVLAVAGLSKMG